MKPIPPFWAQHRESVTFRDGTTWDMTVTGSSFESEADAQRVARERLAHFAATSGPDLDAPTDWYYPARQLPEELLEEIRGADGTLIAAITRNRYGARILNTDAVLITDIDFPHRAVWEELHAPRGGFFSRLFGRGETPSQADIEQRKHEEITGLIDDFAQRNPDLGVRTYRTRNGYRVLMTGADAPPRSERAARIMADLSSDELYMALCRVQDCYRARLTPKPWRIGMFPLSDLGRWPKNTPEHAGWIEEYEAAVPEHAVCELLGTTGPAPSAEEQRITDLHDRAVLRQEPLPLA